MSQRQIVVAAALSNSATTFFLPKPRLGLVSIVKTGVVDHRVRLALSELKLLVFGRPKGHISPRDDQTSG
jgi:hypothetical protein